MVRFSRLILVVAALSAASPAHAATSRLVRTSLDGGVAQVAAPHAARVIRSTLEDASHADFPLEDASVRLIRVSLEDGEETYGPLAPPPRSERAVRTTLD